METTQQISKLKQLINSFIKESLYPGFGNSFDDEYTSSPTLFDVDNDDSIGELWYLLRNHEIKDLNEYLGGKENRSFQIFLINSGTVIEHGAWMFKNANKFPNKNSFIQFVRNNFSNQGLEEINVLRNNNNSKEPAQRNMTRENVWDKIDMSMSEDMNTLPFEEISDIASECNVNEEYVAELLGAYLIDRSKKRVQELKEEIEYILNEVGHDAPFEDAYDYFIKNNYIRDFPWVTERVFKDTFNNMTTNPNQGKLFNDEHFN